MAGFKELNDTLGTVKTSLDNLVSDSSAPITHTASAALDHAAFTDNGDATCKITTGISLPAGAVVIGTKLEWKEAPNVTGAAGETTITSTIGDATGGDVDRLGGAMAQTLASTGSFYADPVGLGGYDASTAVWLHCTLSGGTPDAGNFVSASGAGKAVVTIVYRSLLSL